MKQARSKDGTSIAFDQTGHGPPVILVDGALCYRANGPMAPLAQLLAPRFTVYTYDRRGRGDSSDTRPYAVEREVEDIEALLQEAGGSAFVYGTSSGAALALEAGSTAAAVVSNRAARRLTSVCPWVGRDASVRRESHRIVGRGRWCVH